MKLKKVSLIHGDITTLPVDALVNSANKSLLGGGGLDYVIHKKAGILMKNACKKLNTEKGGCKTGHADVTIAGDLPAKFVIHAVGPRWLDGTRGEPQLLCNAYINALLRAEEVKAKTVSFPNISTGIYSFPQQLAAEIAIGTILSTLPTYSAIKHIFFVCKEIKHYETYKNILLGLEDSHIDILI